MSCVAGYSKHKKELEYINKTVNTNIARYFENDWQVKLFYSIKEFAAFVGETEIIDFLCVDVCESIAISLTELIRQKNKNTIILLMADTSVSPAKYMKPSIMAAALLLFPLNEENVKETVNELFRYMIDSGEEDNSDFFVIKSKSQHERIPNDKIQYFESRDKKLYLNTLKREYGFYETIDGVMEGLPDYFIRCHRSYVVNSKKIKKVLLSQNVVELESGIEIPLSKSYKPMLKEFRKNAGI
ncbi:MAG: response regulator transcription factor [Eubacterium sp.]|nr:response regulator transcription factor [Eubacterium sp.]